MQLSPLSRLRVRIVSVHRKTVALLVVLLIAGAVAASQLLAGVDRRGATVRHFTIKSRFAGRALHEIGIVPAGAGKRPLLVFLHGRGLEPGSLLSEEFYAGLARLGKRAPIVVALDGGDHSYWHDRRDGRWGSYVLREAIPEAVRVLGADGSRVAIGGISMGGYGAFELAREARRGRFCAVGGHSPAFWLSAGQSAPGAFDDAADFNRHDVYSYVRTRAHPYGSTPLWIDRGTRDPFAPYDASIVRELKARGARLESHVWPGEHSGSYWRAHMARYLRFYADALARC
jgi:dipeptidyl aminopeptidase/acylaminoacyl peptidase